jgi:hypothetical protein
MTYDIRFSSRLCGYRENLCDADGCGRSLRGVPILLFFLRNRISVPNSTSNLNAITCHNNGRHSNNTHTIEHGHNPHLPTLSKPTSCSLPCRPPPLASRLVVVLHSPSHNKALHDAKPASQPPSFPFPLCPRPAFVPASAMSPLIPGNARQRMA